MPIYSFFFSVQNAIFTFFCWRFFRGGATGCGGIFGGDFLLPSLTSETESCITDVSVEVSLSLSLFTDGWGGTFGGVGCFGWVVGKWLSPVGKSWEAITIVGIEIAGGVSSLFLVFSVSVSFSLLSVVAVSFSVFKEHSELECENSWSLVISASLLIISSLVSSSKLSDSLIWGSTGMSSLMSHGVPSTASSTKTSSVYKNELMLIEFTYVTVSYTHLTLPTIYSV